MKISKLENPFYQWLSNERGLCGNSLRSYKERLKAIKNNLGDISIYSLDLSKVTLLKVELEKKKLSTYYIIAILWGLRTFLEFCKIKKLKVLNYKKIRTPKKPKPEIEFLTLKEIQKIRVGLKPSEIRERALIETLLATGGRISEVLSLNRDSIDWHRKEARIVGKGKKPRKIYFTPKALYWIEKYLKTRDDSGCALFVSKNNGHKRISPQWIQQYLADYRKRLRFSKRINPHIFRHTYGSHLVANGCPINYVKELLGHSDLQTTITYYIGTDHSKIKEAYQQYLRY